MKRIFLLTILLLSVSVFTYAQRDWSKMQVETTELAPGIYRLFVGEAVAVVVFEGEDGILVIDAAYEQTTTQLMEAIRNISDKRIKYLVNTHLHADHTGGNGVVGKDATIIAHHSVTEWLTSDRKRGNSVPGPASANALPDLTFEGDMKLYFNDAVINMKHMPEAHTRGDVILHFAEANVLVLGDLLFAGFFPFVDVSQGGNPHGLIKHLHWVVEHFDANTILVGGHGPVFNMNELRTYINRLEGSISAIRIAKSAGKSPDEMKEQRILSEWESFGQYFITEDRWIDIIYPFVESE